MVPGCSKIFRALECQAFLDSATERDLTEVIGFKELMTRASSSSMEGSSGRQEQGEGSGETSEEVRKSQVLATAAMKFTYVVAAQIYGEQKKIEATQAKGIAYLLETYKGLRITYVDEVESAEGKQYFSVLVKYDRVAQKEVEIFRVQLPGPLILGEGKPENQNHALIFTRGDAVQTIDMNQVRTLLYCTLSNGDHTYDQRVKLCKNNHLISTCGNFQTAS